VATPLTTRTSVMMGRMYFSQLFFSLRLGLMLSLDFGGISSLAMLWHA
jgi:hypothetical protein